MTIQETVHGLFEAQAARTPDHIAAVFAGQSISYAELNKRANQLGHYLKQAGVKSETPVALCMERSIDCLVTIFAILKVGGAYVPLDLSQPEERLLFILNDNKIAILIIKSESSEAQKKINHYHGALIVLDNDAKKISEQATSNLGVFVAPQNLAYVMYTSGSTGTPKGVLIEHRSVVNYCFWFADYCCCHQQQRIDFSSNYIFDMAVTNSIVPLTLGLTIVICDEMTKSNMAPYFNYLIYHRINIIKITPSYFKVLLHEVKIRSIELPYLQSIILGGEALSTVDCATWLALYPEHVLYNEYGPTEATVGFSQYKVCTNNISSLGANVPIGKPGPNMVCHLLDANNRPVSDREVGELYIGGVGLARGYLNQPQLTQKHFIYSQDNGRLYKVGDLCRQQPDGTLEYLGRADSQLKIRGFRVEPGEIEKHLLAHPAIDDVVVLARDGHTNEKVLVAYYILKKGSSAIDARQLRRYLHGYLPDYMIPPFFVRMKAFPLTANGKLNQSLLPLSPFISHQHYQMPSTLLDKTLAKIWSEELNIKTIGLDDDFFELGGHSLSAARIVSNINHSLGINITLNEFYTHPTIGKLVNRLYHQGNLLEKNPVQSIKTDDNSVDIPLNDFQFMLWIANIFEPKAKKLNITARRQMHGRLNVAALIFAFESVFIKHELLLCQILKFRPTQRLHKNISFEVIEKNIEILTEQASELVLETSVKQLMDYYPWSQGAPMVKARLFYLNGGVTELQVCMPHIISDDISLDILFLDLSKFYLLYYYRSVVDTLSADIKYKHYAAHEQHYFKSHLNRDIIFWKEYFKDASAFAFPSEHVVKDMKSQKYSYSTYVEIPQYGLTNLQRFCAKNKISIHDGLCAALMLAIYHCCGCNNIPQSIFINRVKSTRDNASYDDAVGCFLRLEPIKISINNKSNLTTLSKQIHQSVIQTERYQQCPSLLKFASVSRLYRKRTFFSNFLIDIFVLLYTKICPTIAIYRKIFNLRKLSSLKTNNNFYININVNNSFIDDKPNKNESILFGLKTKNIKNNQVNLLEIDYMFDVCFLRNGAQNLPYLVISANLKPAFRELIASEWIKIISSNRECILTGNVYNETEN